MSSARTRRVFAGPFIRALVQDRSGASAVEYLVLVATLGLGTIAAVRSLSTSAATASQRVGAHVASLSPMSGVAGGQDPSGTPAAAPGAPSAPTDPAGSGDVDVAAVPSPRPGPAPSPPAASSPPEPPALTDAKSPPVVWLHMGTDQGDRLIMRDSSAIAFMELKRRGRVEALARAGEDHDTDVYGPSDARDQVWTMTAEIQELAARYGLDPALLSGVLASEIDFDTDVKDVAQNIATRLGIEGGQGPGAANVHLDQLEQAKRYLQEHNLPGADAAAKFDGSFDNVYDHPVEAAAIVVAWKADLKRRAGGTVSSPEDMAVVFGSFRAGEENFDLVNNRAREGADDLVRRTGDHNAAMGANAYQSQPYFEYYIEYYKGLDEVRSGGTEPV